MLLSRSRGIFVCIVFRLYIIHNRNNEHVTISMTQPNQQRMTNTQVIYIRILMTFYSVSDNSYFHMFWSEIAHYFFFGSFFFNFFKAIFSNFVVVLMTERKARKN
jgi:hypothetical protein